MGKHFAVIGDLKGSRQITNRAQAQREIKQALEDINLAYPACIVSKWTLTLGDEFQALLTPEDGMMRMLDELMMRLQQYPFRLGIGYGDISTEIDPHLSIGADGEGFWRARAAIDYVHGNGTGGMTSHFIGFGNLKDDVVNALLASSDTIRDKWTTLQKETFHLMLKQGIYAPQFEQHVFAETIGISQSSLTKRLNASNIKQYIQLRKLIETCFREWRDEHQ